MREFTPGKQPKPDAAVMAGAVKARETSFACLNEADMRGVSCLATRRSRKGLRPLLMVGENFVSRENWGFSSVLVVFLRGAVVFDTSILPKAVGFSDD